MRTRRRREEPKAAAAAAAAGEAGGGGRDLLGLCLRTEVAVLSCFRMCWALNDLALPKNRYFDSKVLDIR